ncbi:MAG: A/G-specific adenine glycosylase [Clostridia bacterium]|nr:A/G-specific adenine glycosylase [Clostridia bacterium]
MDWNLFINKMQAWYDANARVLPWRENHDPYRVWVSEIMLQQTRVDTVIPYYNRFMERFPTVEALARADEATLLKHWEGLGYYTRARNLQKAAKTIVEQYNGIFPENYDAVRALPGIGDYTTGAICSIAFEQPTPAVDGNVLRVFSRLLADDSDILDSETKKRYTQMLAAAYPLEKRGDFTQSLMELGALICVPGTPACERCPVQTMCTAFKDGTQELYPVRQAKKEKKIEQLTVLMISDGTHLAISKREKGLLANMWQFPNVPGWLDEMAVQENLTDMGYGVRKVAKGKMVKHIFTHVEWQMQVFHCDVERVQAPYLTEETALPTAFRKLLK